MKHFEMAKENGLMKFGKMRKHIENSMLKSGGILVISLLLFAFLTIPGYALVDPSAVYCTALGYNYVTESTSQGERGLCRLPNNQSVDAWEFLKGKVSQEYSYCQMVGYEIKTVQDKEKCLEFLEDDCAVCILEDGTEVEVTELMDLSFEETTCGDGTCGIPEKFATCPQDCPSGSYDGYCDGIPDGKCDSDCLKGEDSDCHVIIDDCDSGVQNKLLDNGFMMSDLIARCEAEAKNHGGFVSCVAYFTTNWQGSGLISGKEKDAIQKCAAKADIP